MEELSLAAVAAMTARDVLRAHPELGGSGAEDLAHRLETAVGAALRPERVPRRGGGPAHRVETALGTPVRQERLACVAECERRKAIWTETEERPATPPSLR